MINERGQALIIVIFGIALCVTILTASVVVAITLGKNARLGVDAQTALYGAESGAEGALLKLTRNPSACSGTDSFNLNSTSVSVTYSFASPFCTINTSATVGTILKKIQVQVTLLNQRVTLNSWKEIP